jgi:hypothetical protein
VEDFVMPFRCQSKESTIELTGSDVILINVDVILVISILVKFGQHQVIVSVYNRLETFFRLLFGHAVVVACPPFVRICKLWSE